MINEAKIAVWGISAEGVACLATVTAIYWKNITENPFLKSLFNSIYEVTYMGELLKQMEREAPPLEEDIPDYKFLSSSDSTTEERTGFGKKYGNALVSAKNNDDWWKWSAKIIKDVKTLEGVFEKLKNKGENDFADLRTECSNAYKKKDEELKGGKRENVWFLCSPFKTQPYSNSDISKTDEEITSLKENLWKYCSLSGKDPEIPKTNKS